MSQVRIMNTALRMEDKLRCSQIDPKTLESIDFQQKLAKS